MTHQPHNNKGWLRQYIAQPTAEQIDRFNDLVENLQCNVKTPTEKQMEKWRMLSYRRMLGAEGVLA